MRSEEKNVLEENSLVGWRVRGLIAAVSLALLATLGGCKQKAPNSLEKCLGKDRATEIEGRLGRMRKVCHERVNDYVHINDGKKMIGLRKDAEHACGAYKDELDLTIMAIRTKWDELRRVRKWSRRNECEVAEKVTLSKAKALKESDSKVLEEE